MTVIFILRIQYNICRKIFFDQITESFCLTIRFGGQYSFYVTLIVISILLVVLQVCDSLQDGMLIFLCLYQSSHNLR